MKPLWNMPIGLPNSAAVVWSESRRPPRPAFSFSRSGHQYIVCRMPHMAYLRVFLIYFVSIIDVRLYGNNVETLSLFSRFFNLIWIMTFIHRYSWGCSSFLYFLYLGITRRLDILFLHIPIPAGLHASGVDLHPRWVGSITPRLKWRHSHTILLFSQYASFSQLLWLQWCRYEYISTYGLGGLPQMIM